MTFQELVVFGIEEEANTLVIVGERRCNPSILRIYDLKTLNEKKQPLHAYTIFLKGIVLSRERSVNTALLNPKNILIESRPAKNMVERDLILSLYKMFGSSIGTIESKDIINSLRIKIMKRKGYYKIDFRYGLNAIPVGPLIKIDGVRRIGRYTKPDKS